MTPDRNRLLNLDKNAAARRVTPKILEPVVLESLAASGE